jgi:hypothetical protein
MVTLTSPITAQNIVDRFKELVTDVADTSIVWGTDNLPGHSAFTTADFGGVVDGMSLVLINTTGTFTVNETVTGSISATTGVVVSYSSNTLKVRNIVPGSGQTNFLQNDILTGASSGAIGTISTLTEVSAVSVGVTGGNIGNTGSLIDAYDIYSTLKNEMNNYTNIKNCNAVVNLTGGAQQYNQTEIAHLTTAQRVTLTPSQPGALSTGALATSTSVENYLSTLASSYTSERANTYTMTKTICHSSCHSSCHGSRSRR